MKKLSLFVLAVGLALPVFAQTKSLLNLDKTGVAIQGYDSVGFFTDNKPVKGDPKFLARRDGAIYLFASKEHKEMFTNEPAKHEPAFLVCAGGALSFDHGRCGVHPVAAQMILLTKSASAIKGISSRVGYRGEQLVMCKKSDA
jgi:YHS domain-containing protein